MTLVNERIPDPTAASRNAVISNFKKNFVWLSQNANFQELARCHNVKVDILQECHKNGCIDLLRKELKRNNLRRLLGFSESDYLAEANRIGKQWIDTNTAIVILNDETDKVIGIGSFYDYCELHKFESMPKNIIISNDSSECSDDAPAMFSYLSQKYENEIGKIGIELKKQCIKNDGYTYTYGKNGYGHLAIYDSKYFQKPQRTFVLYFAYLLPIALFLKDYQCLYTRFSNPIAFGATHRIYHSLKQFENGKYNNVIKFAPSWDFKNDEKFVEYMIKKFGSKEQAINRMKKYGAIIVGGTFTKPNIDNFDIFEFWNALCQGYDGIDIKHKIQIMSKM